MKVLQAAYEVVYIAAAHCSKAGRTWRTTGSIMQDIPLHLSFSARPVATAAGEIYDSNHAGKS
jgi:hypothetical protein